jgi:hypothetical protein
MGYQDISLLSFMSSTLRLEMICTNAGLEWLSWVRIHNQGHRSGNLTAIVDLTMLDLSNDHRELDYRW